MLFLFALLSFTLCESRRPFVKVENVPQLKLTNHGEVTTAPPIPANAFPENCDHTTSTLPPNDVTTTTCAPHATTTVAPTIPSNQATTTTCAPTTSTTVAPTIPSNQATTTTCAPPTIAPTIPSNQVSTTTCAPTIPSNVVPTTPTPTLPPLPCIQKVCGERSVCIPLSELPIILPANLTHLKLFQRIHVCFS